MGLCFFNCICYVGLCDTNSVVYFRNQILYHAASEITLPDDATVPEKIRFYRLKKNIDGDTLAGYLDVNRAMITYYEKGHCNPTVATLKRIAVALNIEPDLLFDDYYRFLDYPYTERLKQIRTENNLTSSEFGAILGVSSVTINAWQRGQHVMNRKAWEKLKALGLL